MSIQHTAQTPEKQGSAHQQQQHLTQNSQFSQGSQHNPQEDQTYLTQTNHKVFEQQIDGTLVRFNVVPQTDEESNQMLMVEQVGVDVLRKNLKGPVLVNSYFSSVNFIQVRNNILNALSFLKNKFVYRQRVGGPNQQQQGYGILNDKDNHCYGQNGGGNSSYQQQQSSLQNSLIHAQGGQMQDFENRSHNDSGGAGYYQGQGYMSMNNMGNNKQFEKVPAKEIWKEALEQPANDLIFNDGFWLIVLLKNESKIPYEIFSEIYEVLLNRIAINYMEFKADYKADQKEKDKKDDKDKELFFQIYFDIVSQAVFYAFFFAFPKSRKQFTDDYKIFVFNEFSYLFTGLKISHRSEFVPGWNFIQDWCLELGTGNVFQIYQDNDELEDKLPQIMDKGAGGRFSNGPEAKRQLKFNLNGFRTKIEEQEFKIKNRQQMLQRMKDTKGNIMSQNQFGSTGMNATGMNSFNQQGLTGSEQYSSGYQGSVAASQRKQVLQQSSRSDRQQRVQVKKSPKKPLKHPVHKSLLTKQQMRFQVTRNKIEMKKQRELEQKDPSVAKKKKLPFIQNPQNAQNFQNSQDFQSSQNLQNIQNAQKQAQQKQQKQQSQNPIVKNNIKVLKYSPIAERYLNLRKYKTKNYLKSNNMKLTPYDETQNQYEYKKKVFDQWVDQSHQVLRNHNEKYYKEKDAPPGKMVINKKRRESEDLRRKINEIKLETQNHIRRLEKRRIEELEKGCHEYANYLVSMLNAGTKNYIVDQ